MNTDTTQDIPFIPAPEITTVAGYLLTRLAEAGVISVFGVAGDYNLPILDAITSRPDLAWIGMATEQGAGYAADTYARLRGIGALVTTFGVGELSALNAIAEAYAKSVPVVHIVGTPALAARRKGATLHHNLPGGDYGHFARMAAEVTAAQADLRPDTAPEEIDRVLATALRTSRPVYLTIPADVAGIPVLAPEGPLPQLSQDADPAVVAAFIRHARRVLAAAAGASLLIGHLAARHRVTAQVRDFEIAGDFPVAPPWERRWPRRTAASYWSPVTAPCSRPRPSSAPLLGQGLAPVIIVLNNGGYTIERAIHQPRAGYHQIPAWDWTTLAATMSPAASPVALRAGTPEELAYALNAAGHHAGAGRPVLIEAVLGASDAPPLLQDLTRALATAAL